MTKYFKHSFFISDTFAKKKGFFPKKEPLSILYKMNSISM